MNSPKKQDFLTEDDEFEDSDQQLSNFYPNIENSDENDETIKDSK